MKKYYIYFLMSILGLSACQQDGVGLLDKAESGDMTEEKIFSDGIYARKYIANVYSRLPKGYARFSFAKTPVYLGCCTDEGQQGPIGMLTQALWFNEGTWNAVNIPTELPGWAQGWTSIRPANTFIQNIDKVPVNVQTGMTEEEKKRLKEEARFLRAFAYADLARSYGGVPIINIPLNSSSPELYTPRSTFDETIKYIVEQLDSAAMVLPANYRFTEPEEYGRATSVAAKAIKGRTLLYAARPLFNDPQNTNRIVAGEYDEGKWRVAAEANAEAIKLAEANGYGLHIEAKDKKSSYEKFFVTRVNDEVILSYMKPQDKNCELRQLPKRFLAANSAVAGYSLPTLDLVDDYEMKNGKSIHEAGSGYNEQDPYKNRDQRFYASIFYNGADYRGQKIETFRGKAGTKVVDGKDYNSTYVNTGFYLRKFVDVTIDPKKSELADHNYPIIRYAEVLLNYAEAMNEAFGPEVDGLGNGKTAKWAIDQIRDRAMQPALPSGLGKDEMRTRIKRERRIELAFEEHRFWDVRHWKDADSQKQVWLQVIEKDEKGKLTYSREKRDRVFEAPKMFLMPIPFEQVANGSYEQNPGW